jgi:hypothetical protein
MRLRRCLLLAAFTAFVLAVLQPTWGVCADGPGDVDASAFGANVPSRMACGPDVRVKYGGIGGQVSTHLGDDAGRRPGTGFVLGAGAAGAYDHVLLLGPCRSLTTNCAVPPSFFEGAIAGRLGYDWSWFGFRAGILFWGVRDGGFPFPDISLRFGAVDGVRFVAGLGAYDVPTMLRPGLYAGLVAPLEKGWELELHVGQHLGIAGLASVRAHGGMHAPIGPRSWLSLGGALWANELGVGPEGDLGWGSRF